jgi:hypothetical protein
MTSHETLAVFTKTLDNLGKWMDKAEEHAKARSFDVQVLADARLAPDAFAFVEQVQSACDQAKYAAAYLSGQAPPSHPDTEKTFPELRERIAKTKSFVAGVTAQQLEGGEERKVAPKWMGGRWLPGGVYLAEMAVPNFYFHVAMAYAILRHNGVALGKMDYIGGLPTREG